jgi:hypothetical protein
MGDRLVTKPLTTQNSTSTEQKQTDMHASSGIRTTIPMFEQAKIFLAIDFSANAIGF